MADHPSRTKRALPDLELELDFKPSTRPVADEEEDDAGDQPIAMELGASPHDRFVGKSAAATVASPGNIALDATVASEPGATHAPASVKVNHGPPSAERSVAPPAPTLASSGLGAPPASAREAPQVVPAPGAAPPANPAARTLASAVESTPPPAPKVDVAELARGVAAASTKTPAGAAMIGAAVLLTLLSVAYTRATSEAFPVNFTWISLPLALAGGGVLAYRLLQRHA